MNRSPGRVTFLLSLLATGAFLVAAVKIWHVPSVVLWQLLVLCIALFSLVIVLAWLLIKLLGILRVRGRIKKVVNDESN